MHYCSKTKLAAASAMALSLMPTYALAAEGTSMTTLSLGAGCVIFLIAAVAGWYRAASLRSTLATLTAYCSECLTKESALPPLKELAPVASLAETLAQTRAELKETKQALDAAAQELSAAKGLAAATREKGEDARRRGLLNSSDTMKSAIEGIRSANEHLNEASRNASEGSEQQRQLAGEASVAMDQMNAAVSQVAEASEAASSHSDTTRTRAQEGAQAVQQTVGAIMNVHERALTLESIVNGLGEKADAVDEVMEIISNIADQTNLLALNAAIEAARAGDAGRGFAVVADEVRKLAEKTMQATGEVASQINAIKSGVQETHTSMQETASIVNEATELASQSGELLDSIVVLAEESAGQIQSIAAAASQQAASAEHINTIISQVDTISSSTSGHMQESIDSLGELTSEVTNLANLNRVFQLIGSGKAHEVINSLVTSADIISMEPDRQEAAMRQSIRNYPFVELLFLTDANGVQPTANIPRPGNESPADAQAKGTNWSSRPWFTGPMETESLYVSSVYQSSASGQDCITISSPIRDGEGKILGIVAADVTIR